MHDKKHRMFHLRITSIRYTLNIIIYYILYEQYTIVSQTKV